VSIDEDGCYSRGGKPRHAAGGRQLMDKDARERRIFRLIAGTMMVGLLCFGLSLIAYQNYNQKKRADLPQQVALLPL
jgi:hypothetical protein